MQELLVKEPEGLEPIEDGTYKAVCVSVIDMGTQTMTYKDEVKDTHRVRVSWELEPQAGDEQPRILGKDYTFSLHAQSALRKDLKTWLERDLTEYERKNGFNLFEMAAKPAKLIVTNEEAKNGNSYANITGVLADVGSDLVADSQVYVYAVDTPDRKIFEIMPEFIQKRIEAAKEYTPF